MDDKGLLSMRQHPINLGSALTHPYITTDYSEALLEFVTPPRGSNSEALDFLKGVDFPTAKQPIRTADYPVSMSGSRSGIRHRAPMLGEHTDEILSELGYSEASIADLRSRRVV